MSVPIQGKVLMTKPFVLARCQVKELKRNVTDMQTELQDALQRAAAAVAQEQKATLDSKLQVIRSD